MGKAISIGNLDAGVTQADVLELLSQHGEVEAIELLADETSGEKTQIALVAMHSSKDGRSVMAALDGQTHAGRELKVKALKNAGGPTPGKGGGYAGLGGNRGRQADAFGGRSGAYGRKGRGKAGGRNR